MLQIHHDPSVIEEALTAELAVIVPTFNEQGNIAVLLNSLEEALFGIEWEVIFVDDDSTDGTVETIEQAARDNPRLRCIRRLGRRGLSSAVVEGIQSTFSPFIAVMDADLQHDETLLVPMLEILRRGDVEVVVGTRYAAGGGCGEWASTRRKISLFATELSRLVLKGRTLSDPMSGFFMVQRTTYNLAARKLSLQGYKILLDLIVSSAKNTRVVELPYVFRVRQHGESKLDTIAVLDYILLIIDKIVGKWVPARFILFMAVGCCGIGLHMLVLAEEMHLSLPFLTAQASATMIAMTGNFFLNNLLTYRDRRIRGVLRLGLGLMSFYAICSVGAVANVGIAQFIYHRNYSWWLSGLCGILVGAVWNYAASSVVTWRK